MLEGLLDNSDRYKHGMDESPVFVMPACRTQAFDVNLYKHWLSLSRKASLS